MSLFSNIIQDCIYYTCSHGKFSCVNKIMVSCFGCVLVNHFPVMSLWSDTLRVSDFLHRSFPKSYSIPCIMSHQLSKTVEKPCSLLVTFWYPIGWQLPWQLVSGAPCHKLILILQLGSFLVNRSSFCFRPYYIFHQTELVFVNPFTVARKERSLWCFCNHWQASVF